MSIHNFKVKELLTLTSKQHLSLEHKVNNILTSLGHHNYQEIQDSTKH